jgi:hypothetical protein
MEGNDDARECVGYKMRAERSTAEVVINGQMMKG